MAGSSAIESPRPAMRGSVMPPEPDFAQPTIAAEAIAASAMGAAMLPKIRPWISFILLPRQIQVAGDRRHSARVAMRLPGELIALERQRPRALPALAGAERLFLKRDCNIAACSRGPRLDPVQRGGA